MSRTRPTSFRFDPTVLRATREARKLTREYVVTEAGCSLAALSLTELGYKRPSPELLARFCDIVGCSLDDLFVPDDADSDRPSDGAVTGAQNPRKTSAPARAP